MNEYLKKASQVVQNANLPSLASISLSHHSKAGSKFFNVVWKQTNYEITKARRFISPYEFAENDPNPIKKLPIFPIPYDGGLLEKVSPSRKLKASIKKQESTISKKEEFVLEIYSDSKITQTINLSTFDKHSSILADPYFSSLEWSGDEEKIVYVAEKKKPKNEGFFDRKVEPLLDDKTSKPEEKKNEGNDDKIDEKKDSKTVGDKFNYEENWGELLNDITNTVMVVVNLVEETVQILEKIPAGVCPAQPRWLNNNEIIFTGYNIEPFRLGLRVCECRPSNLYTIKVDDNSENAQQPFQEVKNVSDHSARVSPNGEFVIFIRRHLNTSGNMHRGPESLMLHDTKQRSVLELLPDHMLFMHGFSNQCWLSDNIHFVIANDKDGLKFAYILNSETGDIVKEIPCNVLYGVESDLIFLLNHELDSAGATLTVASFKQDQFNIFQEPPQKDSQISYGKLTDAHGVSSYYMLPTEIAKNPIPLVVFPHGGPHVMATNTFRFNAAAFVHLGYAVLLCNYRGSTGFGKENLEALPGNVGDMDIKDVQNFAEILLEKFENRFNKKQIFVFGGSHGGFIGAHLVGQYPDFYSAAALLNPVTDMSAMMMVTDIPDWTFVESGVPYEQGTIPSPEILAEMVKRSPIVHLKKVKAPVLLLVGGKDLRVPPSQSKSYYRLLRANGKTAKMLYYPEDSHPLLNIETDGDFFVNVLKWFYEHNRE
ncbi:acylamino-acid-releasing enzyme-like [Clytia hemisphaerica]|uniref:acylaminoacyl-peptidase n=1 Tax=Clytia hemisphaerica TaxID=252671 RepID=A0A7M5WS69_9CNID